MFDVNFSYGDLEYFLLILMRVASFIAVAPLFGMQGVPPNRVKTLFAVLISMMLYGTVPMVPLKYDSILYTKDGVLISDHLPLVATFRIIA